MSWATHHIEKLRKGETVQFRPIGNSMKGKIESGQLVTVCPIREQTLKVDDIVLCKVKGGYFLHLIKAINAGKFQIGNNKGSINGWIAPNAIFGICIEIVN